MVVLGGPCHSAREIHLEISVSCFGLISDWVIFLIILIVKNSVLFSFTVMLWFLTPLFVGIRKRE